MRTESGVHKSRALLQTSNIILALTVGLICCRVDIFSCNRRITNNPRSKETEWSLREIIQAHPLLGLSSTAREKSNISPFEKVISSRVFIDRTFFIRYVVRKSPSLLYITAPRKFGKTINLHMLNSFFSPTSTDNPLRKPTGDKFHPLFSTRQLNIMRDSAIVTEHMLEHPVISLDFSKLRVSNVLSFKESFGPVVLQPAYRAHGYLRNSTALSAEERSVVEKFLTSTVSESATVEGGRTLLELLNKHFNRSVLVLIEDFDKPLKKMMMDSAVSAVTVEIVVEYIHKFLRRLFDVDLILLHERAPLLFSAVTTGTSQLASIFFPRLGVEMISFAEKEIAKYYTVSQKEVNKLRSVFDATLDETKSLRRWYEGYKIRDADSRVYSIYSVVSYFTQDEPRQLKQFWVKSESLGVLRSLFTYEYLGRKIHACVSEGSTSFMRSSTYTLQDVMVMKDVFDAENLGGRHYGPHEFEKKLDAILRFLLDEGYFTALRQFTTLNRTAVTIGIPNFEIRSEILAVLYRAAYIGTEIERPTFLQIGSNLTSALATANEASIGADLRWFLESFTSLLDRSDFQPKDEVEMAIVMGSALYIRDPEFKTVELFRENYEYMPQEKIDALVVVRDPRLNLIGYVIEMKFRWKSAAEALHKTVSYGYSKVFQDERFRENFKRDVAVFVLVGLHCAVEECHLQYLFNSNDFEKRSHVISVRRRTFVPNFDVQLDLS